MWGFSPALDLLDGVPAEKKELRVLVAKPSDIRHVLATISRRRRHSMPQIHFFIVENQLEVIARHLLLLQIISDWELPIRQRATVFLEVFGNTCIQERTERYVHRLGQELVDLVCNGEGGLVDLIDLSALKYRERDELVAVFNSWNPAVPYDVVGLRDQRLRAHFGLRYDHRVGVIDWDYQARVKPAASIIHQRLYKEWRLSGLAFEFGDQRYEQPNRTLGSYAEGVMKKGKDKGLKKEIRGYWIDVVNSPYVAFGVDCDKSTPHAEDLFHVQNKDTGVEQHRHHSVEVAVFNLLSYLWEIETGEAYLMAKKDDIYSGLGEDASDFAVMEKEGSEVDHRRQQALQRARCIVDTFSGVKVTMVRSFEKILGKPAFAAAEGNGFDVVHLSSSTAHHLDDPAFASILMANAHVVVETGQFLVPMTDEQEVLYRSKVSEYAASRGLKVSPGAPTPGSMSFDIS